MPTYGHGLLLRPASGVYFALTFAATSLRRPGSGLPHPYLRPFLRPPRLSRRLVPTQCCVRRNQILTL